MTDLVEAAAEGGLILDTVSSINDPLASLLLSLDEAAQQALRLTSGEADELAQLIEEARASAQRVAGTVCAVISVPKAPVCPITLDANEVVEQAAQRVRAQRADVNVRVEVGRAAPFTSVRERLELVLMHMLLTAPPDPDGVLCVETRGREGDVLIQMRAGGVPDAERRAFERRYAVISGLVRQMGGGCETEMTTQGLCVRLRFGAMAGALDDQAAEPSGQLRILVVDDEPSIHRALRRALRDVGRVRAVSSGNAAIEVLEGGARFDVVLCDVVMANGTGLDLANWLERQSDPLKRRLILMTGRGDNDNVSHPNVVTIAKPFDSSALRELVHQVAART